jgi:hypothetical protein
VFRPDGSLLVIESNGPPAQARVIDADGTPGGVIDLGGRTPVHLSSDPSTGWTLVSTADGLLAIDPLGAVSTIAAGRFRAADW